MTKNLIFLILCCLCTSGVRADGPVLTEAKGKIESLSLNKDGSNYRVIIQGFSQVLHLKAKDIHGLECLENAVKRASDVKVMADLLGDIQSCSS